MSRYTSATDADRRAMLEAIGVGSIEELFADVPEGVRLGRELDLPPGRSEAEVYAELRDLAARNVSTEDELTFLGAGMYDHYVPAIVDAMLSRSEFLTPYTPYQPEVSQGTLQVMFEYQTAISELTGLPVSNATLYEGPSAVAAAGFLARLENGRPKLVVSRGLHPHSRETLRTTSAGFGTEIVEIPLKDGVTDPEGARRGGRRGHGRGLPPAAELPGRGRGRRGAGGAREGARLPARGGGRPDRPRRAQAARRAGRRHLRRRGPAARQPARLRRPLVRVLRRHRGPPAPHARPHRRRDDRRGRAPRLRAHAPDPRAAHPPREGHVEHHHRPGAERAGRGRLPLLARPPRPGRIGELLLRRTAYARDALVAIDGVEPLTSSRSSGASSPTWRSTRPSTRCAA